MRLFISYAHVDKAIVQDWIVSKLLAGGHDVWFDTRLVAGQEWKQQLSDAIERSDALVYCITPEAIASEWCQWELARAVEFGKPVVPVLMQARTEIPASLSRLQYVDFSDGPTGDAVARLIGGLQQLSPTQIPPAPTNPQGTPSQAIDSEKSPSKNIMVKLLSHPATQAIIGIVGVLIAVVALLVSGSGGSNPELTRTAEFPTPMTPIVVALRDLDIRSGPDADFPRLNILPIDGVLDILGISEDRLWYQVLLADGRRGWVLATSTGIRLEGDRGVVRVIVPTLTPSHTPTDTSTPTDTPTSTTTAIPINVPTETYTVSAIPTDTDTPPPPTATDTPSPTTTNTQAPTSAPTPTGIDTVSPTAAMHVAPTTVLSTQNVNSSDIPVIQTTSGQYPCEGTITGTGSDRLFVVYNRANARQSPIDSVIPGSNVMIIDDTQSGGHRWFQIMYGERQQNGWVWDTYVEPSVGCP